MLTCDQISTMVGPETPACTCEGCTILVAVREAINAPVAALDRPGASAWIAALVVAANRAYAQGAPVDALLDAVAHGANQALKQNPLLCGPAPAGRPN